MYMYVIVIWQASVLMFLCIGPGEYSVTSYLGNIDLINVSISIR